jgi:beta-RFAP synthase
LEVVTAPRGHTGLGSGTQLALAVAASLHALFERPPASAAHLARSVGRGLRSAVGTYGFEQGGLIVEAGKWREDEISPLVARLELPAAWRFVLLAPRRHTGLHGPHELLAFDSLPAVPKAVTERLAAEVLLHLLPAAAAGDFDQFSDSLYRYGYTAGLCFQTAQHGAFATPDLQQLADNLRAHGIRGVGQSSWGPTLLALTANDCAAQELTNWLTTSPPHGPSQPHDLDIVIAHPDSHGATIVIDNQPPKAWRSCLSPE